MMFRILLDLLTMCGKIKKYAPKWWFFMVFCHGPKQKNTLNKSKILELPKIRFPEDVRPFNTNLQSAKSSSTSLQNSYMAHLRMFTPVKVRESQRNLRYKLQHSSSLMVGLLSFYKFYLWEISGTGCESN